MSALSDKLAAVKMPHRDVTICLDGALALEREEAYANLVSVIDAVKKAEDGKGDTRMSGAGLKKAKKAVEDVDARVREVAITLRFTAVSFGEYNKFIMQNPPRKGKDETFNPSTFYMFVARRTGQYVGEDGTVSNISKDEWDGIEASLTDGEHDKIATAINLVNRQDSMRGINFLSSNSEKTPSSSENSGQPDSSESPTGD